MAYDRARYLDSYRDSGSIEYKLFLSIFERKTANIIPSSDNYLIAFGEALIKSIEIINQPVTEKRTLGEKYLQAIRTIKYGRKPRGKTNDEIKQEAIILADQLRKVCSKKEIELIDKTMEEIGLLEIKRNNHEIDRK